MCPRTSGRGVKRHRHLSVVRSVARGPVRAVPSNRNMPGESVAAAADTVRVSADDSASGACFHEEAVRGLQAPSGTGKRLPYALLYDHAGSELFEQICDLPEYYPTREERRLILESAAEIVSTFPPGCVILELGCGSASKTKHLLEAYIRLHGKATFAAVDISAGALEFAGRELRDLLGHQQLEVVPICADYMEGVRLVRERFPDTPVVVLWLGGSIGNMVHREAAEFLQQMCGVLQPAALVVGIDVWKDASVLYNAYHDRQGVTERFITNILSRLNSELRGDFVMDKFRYRVIVNDVVHRVEMYLESVCDQTVTLYVGPEAHRIVFAAGELVLVEYSHKYTPDEVERLALQAGLRLQRVVRSPMFSLVVLRAPDRLGA